MKNMFSLLAFAALFAGIFMLGGCITPPTQNATVTNVSFAVETGSNTVLGDPSAPITIVEFTDYQCPYCQRHAVDTFPQIETNYVKTGKVKYYLRDFPLVSIHGDAMGAAMAARCAGEQGKYWEMHSLLFSKQQEWESLSGTGLAAKFTEYAASLGINDQPFSACYSASKFQQQIAADMDAGKLYGISGTPSSIIVFPKTANGTRLLSVLSAYPQYVSQDLLELSQDSQGNYLFFVKGAFPYSIFQQVLNSQ